MEPRYQINLGYMARISKNFGVRQLHLVRPRTKIGSRAMMFSKHAKDLLLNAKVYRDLDSAIRDCSMVIGTTGIWKKSQINFRRVYLMDEAISRAERVGKDKTVGILIGRDDIGLKKEEIEKCDLVAYIGSNPQYPVLNISHALGIMLYLLTEHGFRDAYSKTLDGDKADRDEAKFLFRTFDRLMERKRIRNKKAVKNTFRRLVYLSQPNRHEIHALITALK